MSSAEGRRYIRTSQFRTLKDHVYDLVRRAEYTGYTTRELVTMVNIETPEGFTTYSNPVSGALSRLHNVDGKLLRLKDRRGGFNIYVSPENLLDRDYYRPRPPRAPEDMDLDEVRADAWDEGWETGGVDWSWAQRTPNPYRKDPT